MKLEMIQAMLNLQEAQNRRLIGELWRDKDHLFHIAILVEAAEGIEHLAWKWWKKQEADISAARGEAIDILHFVMSQHLDYYGLSSDRGTAEIFWDKYKDPVRARAPIEAFSAIVAQAAIGDLVHPARLRGLFEALGMSEEAIFRLYCSKAVLNGFRQDNGYKEGIYDKHWDLVEARGPQEDNVYCYEVAEKLNWADPLAPAALRASLDHAYASRITHDKT